MYPNLKSTIENILPRVDGISDSRKEKLKKLVDFVLVRAQKNQPINMTFICTHNSRRSHYSQVWAQVAAAYYDIPLVFSYSGGTEVTGVYKEVIATLERQGFEVFQKDVLSGNHIYLIRFCPIAHPIIGFSKKYDDVFNPANDFAAVMTCTSADENCPFIPNATARISLPFEDPKVSDGTPQQAEVYQERSEQIASELFYVFQEVKKGLA
jgi:arsenate reductase